MFLFVNLLWSLNLSGDLYPTSVSAFLEGGLGVEAPAWPLGSSGKRFGGEEG